MRLTRRTADHGRRTDGTGRARIAFVRFSQVRGLTADGHPDGL